VLLFSRDVCSLSARAPHRTRIHQIPDDHCLFLSMQYNLALLRDVTSPWSRFPFERWSRSSTAGSSNSIPLILFNTHYPFALQARRLSPHSYSPARTAPPNRFRQCCVEGNLAQLCCL
jgi:hypothetical protein